MITQYPFCQISKNYSAEFRLVGMKDLIVQFSHSDKHYLRSIPFNADVISVADSVNRYYTFNPSELSDFLAKEIIKYGRVLFLGVSKGGHGALYQGQLLSRMLKRKIDVFVISAITCISENISGSTFPSLKKIHKDAEKDPALKKALQAATDIILSEQNEKLSVYSVYGEGHQSDKAEALMLKEAHYCPLPMSCHETVIAFLCDMADRQDVYDTLLRAAREKDVAHILQDGAAEAIVDEIMKAPSQPRLGKLCQMIMDGDAYKVFPTAPKPSPVVRLWRLIRGAIG